MITKNTVFILGAGASVPYQYPTGEALYKRISQTPIHDTIICAAKGAEKISDILKDEIQEFHNYAETFKRKLSETPFGSIDFFLENNPEYMDIGKILIAHNLIEKEDPALLSIDDDNWYAYLFKTCLLTTFDEFKHNKISFLTFNYDRSLEYFLFNALKNGFSRSDEETKELLDHFPVVHLYGSLGPLPWQEKGGYKYSPAKKDMFPVRQQLVPNKTMIERYTLAKKSIHIVGEDRTKHFEYAHEIIEEADMICFLGFGFLVENINRLEVSFMMNKNVIGSGFGIMEEEKKAIKRYFSKNGVDPDMFTLGNELDKNTMFLRQNFQREL